MKSDDLNIQTATHFVLQECDCHSFFPQQERHNTHEELKIWYQVNSIMAKWCSDSMRHVPLPGLVFFMYPYPVIPHAQGHCPVL